MGSRTSQTGNPSQVFRVLLWLLHLLPHRFMSVSTSQPTPCMHIYTKRIHQRPALITRRKINTTPQMVSFTQRFLCICISVWVFVRRTPAGKGSLHTLFYIQGWVHDSTSRAFICRGFTPGRSSSTLFQGTSRLMQARWGLHAFPQDQKWNDWQWAVAPQNQGHDGNVAIQAQQLLFLATKERALAFTWDGA